MEEIHFTMEELQANIKELNSGTMHEVDQLVMMVDTQRSIIRTLQAEIKEFKLRIQNYERQKNHK